MAKEEDKDIHLEEIKIFSLIFNPIERASQFQFSEKKCFFEKIKWAWIIWSFDHSDSNKSIQLDCPPTCYNVPLLPPPILKLVLCSLYGDIECKVFTKITKCWENKFRVWAKFLKRSTHALISLLFITCPLLCFSLPLPSSLPFEIQYNL